MHALIPANPNEKIAFYYNYYGHWFTGSYFNRNM